MRCVVSALIVLLFTAPLAAAETAWQQVTPDVAIRLISDGTLSASGTSLMALEIDMPEGTKTYWRVPGETGLPLELDFSGSTGMAGHRMHWPFPSRETANGYLDYVYFGHTVLPFEVAVDDASGGLVVAADMGICSDICIPARVELSLPLVDSAPDRANGVRIRQALAEVPIPWAESPEPIGEVNQVSGEDAIAVEIGSTEVDVESLIVAVDSSDTLFGVPQKSPQPGLVLLPIVGKSDNSALDGLEVELTFMTESGAYLVRRTIGAARH
jgi:DsbC/DsbD-like thiol-disulfide interchange protein